MTTSEFQRLIAAVAAELATDIAALLPQLDRLNLAEALAFITEAYPELVSPYAALASGLTAQWYEELPGREFAAEMVDPDPVEKLAISARWALIQANPVSSMQGTATRSVFTSQRDTVIANSDREGVLWARHASATACGFCRMLATRGAVYRSQRSAQRAHDNCHCLAVPDRDGNFEPAPYVEGWTRDYRAVIAEGARSPQQIAAAMERIAA